MLHVGRFATQIRLDIILVIRVMRCKHCWRATHVAPRTFAFQKYAREIIYKSRATSPANHRAHVIFSRGICPNARFKWNLQLNPYTRISAIIFGRLCARLGCLVFIWHMLSIHWLRARTRTTVSARQRIFPIECARQPHNGRIFVAFFCIAKSLLDMLCIHYCPTHWPNWSQPIGRRL